MTTPGTLLRQVELFAGLDERSLRVVEERLTTRTVPAGTILCREGDPADWMFVVASGELGVVKTADDGTPVQVATLGAGDFGGVMSLLESSPRSATLQARTPAELLVLDHATFSGLLTTDPALTMRLLSSMSRGIRRDTYNLAATLRYVETWGLRDIYEECSPQERLILDTINTKVAGAESLDATMRFLFDAVRTISECDRLCLALAEEEGRRLTVHWVRTTYDGVSVGPGYTEDVGTGSLASALSSGRPRVVDDLTLLPADAARPVTGLLVAEGIRSSMACPLVVEGRTLGVLFRDARRPGAYDEHQVRLHLAVADRLSQAVDKVHRIEQLSAANQAYFGMLGFVAHELKSPIATVVMGLDTLRQGIGGALTPKQIQRVGGMRDKCTYLLGLVEEYLDLARIEGGELAPSFVEDVPFVADVTGRALDLVDEQIRGKGMSLDREGDDEVRLTCAPDLLQIVMTNLLSNAVKYGNDGGRIRLTVRGRPDALDVTVWNQGPGFPDEQRSRLFRKFSRLQTSELLSRRGTGVGLYTTWRIVQAHGGLIGARAEQGSWAEFAFTLPRKPATAQSP